MVDINRFNEKLYQFDQGTINPKTRGYMKEFDNFFNWKLSVEEVDSHILDDAHRNKTHHELCQVLKSWTAYRPNKDYNSWREPLLESLQNISDAYNEIRTFTLLEFTKISTKPLKLIWNELGRIKEDLERRADRYYILAVGKPLMLLWGQTLGFDKNVRNNSPNWVSKNHRWSFNMWYRVMTRIQETLLQEPNVITAFNEEAQARYGSESIVPYGRFLDIYYFL